MHKFPDDLHLASQLMKTVNTDELDKPTRIGCGKDYEFVYIPSRSGGRICALNPLRDPSPDELSKFHQDIAEILIDIYLSIGSRGTAE